MVEVTTTGKTKANKAALWLSVDPKPKSQSNNKNEWDKNNAERFSRSTDRAYNYKPNYRWINATKYLRRDNVIKAIIIKNCINNCYLTLNNVKQYDVRIKEIIYFHTSLLFWSH